MRHLLLIVVSCLFIVGAVAQEQPQDKIKTLKKERSLVASEEREALKKEVEVINERLNKKEITLEEAQALKKEAARVRALNIENRIAILDNQIALLERQLPRTVSPTKESTGEWVYLNEEKTYTKKNNYDNERSERVYRSNDDRFWSINGNNFRYDRRTYSQFVVAVGLNNTIIDGEELGDSPYKFVGSRFLELGWAWRTRVFDNTNWLRFKYGISFQWNGLKPDNNQYFVDNNGTIALEEFSEELNKSKFRTDNLVVPVHFEFGSSSKRERDDYVRYYTRRHFKIGVGGYAGFNIGTRQKLKYRRDGDRVKDKIKRDYQVNKLVYGLSAYAAIGTVGVYAKYDLNPLFKDQVIEQRNISVGVRFDMD
ncbi:coiled-coil domain-containing protein [Spongiivirga citrea]|uniref:Outer membrane beta-barrel protein n=1 Tax=Spongiivirga citrea TaxID=1481457 RepID=A0A6M0CLI5_9FLAO|nr:tropomyosin [Spongiivirga citrea]NER18795.1 hypothetical protein [Spongiivirga citrea]